MTEQDKHALLADAYMRRFCEAIHDAVAAINEVIPSAIAAIRAFAHNASSLRRWIRLNKAMEAERQARDLLRFFPNGRIKHLALHAKKKRVRKKNRKKLLGRLG